MFHRDFSFSARLLCGAAVVAIAAGGHAAAQEHPRIHIEPQSLVSALNEFGVQTGQPVISTPELTASKLSPGVKDAEDPGTALAQLLNGTGLSFRCSGDTYLIVPSPEAGPAPRRCVAQSGAGGSEGADGTVQALIVTAQKREEDIQDVPIAISAFTQEDLTRSQVAGGPDLMTQVPNMTFTKTNFNSYSIQIRGIGTQAVSATVDPAVAVAFNNTPFVRNHFFEQEFYDLERVEVLRGPQGTLYGRNATAGVVNIISAKPKFRYEARLSADVGNYNSQRLEGMINLPLVEDKVALRLAGAWTKRDGYDINEITGNRIDGRDLWSTRASLRVAPNDRLDVNLIWEHFHEDDDRLRSGKQLCHKDVVTEVGGVPVSPTAQFPGSQKTKQQSQLSQGCLPASLYAPESFETPNGLQFGFYWPLHFIGLQVNPAISDPYAGVTQSRDLRVIDSTTDPSYKANNDTVELQFTYHLTDTLSLTSETAWASDFLFSTQDYNRINTPPNMWAQTDSFNGGRPNVLNNGVFCDPQIGCSDRLILVDLIDSKSKDFSEELRLASDFDGPFNFSIGGNFLRYDTEDKYYVFINALTLWASGKFASRITTPYEPNVSDNTECLKYGMREVSLTSSGQIGTSGNCTYIDPNPIGSLNDLGHNYFLSKNPYKLISYAAFGEAYYQIADNLKLTAGLRWTVDKKEAPRIPSWLITTNVGYPVLEVVEQEWREPTGRLTLDWKPDLSFTDETLIYGSIARGYKAGGANPPPAGISLNVKTGAESLSPSDTHPLTFDAEYVNAFELGTKNTLLDGRMTLNATGFYYDYKGYQLSQIVDRSAITKNYDARIWGLELEADWRPLENLRLGFKGGYENTRVADGTSAVDVMDRSNGNQLDYFKDRNGNPVLDSNGDPIPFHWIVVKPFPWYPSNCIMPDVLWTGGGTLTGVQQVGNVSGSGNSGPCDVSYFQGLDIFTMQPYVPHPAGGPNWLNAGSGAVYPNYPGFFPGSAPNNGEGISKDLSGNELPNAPHFTATITADYTLPLPQDWLMTLHTDLYYQSEAWTRIFNTPGYDKLKAYTNVNLAAIFTNEDAGWKVMAYVKNVFNRDSITGAFLNSDDSGLTTNVFLTEPRLYGLRVTKEWTGGPWWTGANPNHPAGEPYPLTVELGGMVQRQDAPYETVRPAFMALFPEALDANPDAQHRDLDWGDGRSVSVTYRPASGPWTVAAAYRHSRINGGNARLHTELLGDRACAFTTVPQVSACTGGPGYSPSIFYTETNRTDITAENREEHSIADFEVGRDLGLGLLAHSSVAAGIRYAQFKSATDTTVVGIPDYYIPNGWGNLKYAQQKKATYDQYSSKLDARREFTGAGPALSWSAAMPFLGDEDTGRVAVDWTVTGGALFGQQKSSVTGQEQSGHWAGDPRAKARMLTNVVTTPVDIQRSRRVTVPVLDLSLGLSYEIQRVKVSTGYRWERYYNVLDAGDTERKQYDRTIDGPYFKIAVGFGG